jgi:AraC-like DNA-binding protein
MPQQRTVLHTGQAFEVAHVRSHHAHSPQWSEVYTIASRRIVFPTGSTLLEVRAGDASWLADGLTAIHFADATAYQLRAEAQPARRSMVISGHSAPGEVREGQEVREAAFYLLSPRQLYQVHLAQWRLRADASNAACVASLVGELPTLRPQAPAPAAGAAVRARHLLAQTAHREPRLSLCDVANAVSRSPFHLARSFRAQTGLSLHRYRQHLRMAAAMERLADGDTDLAGLAHDLGYCGQSHLGAVFRRETGVTLGEARRALSARI